MLPRAVSGLRVASHVSKASRRLELDTLPPRPWVGCSHWTTPFRPLRAFSKGTQLRSKRGEPTGDHLAPEPSITSNKEPISSEYEEAWDSEIVSEVDNETSMEGIVVDQVDPSDASHLQDKHHEADTSRDSTSAPSRPQLPTSIKKLNRLLSHSREMTIPESDLIETFVRGRGPGGQAINKTNSSVSLIHIPTGIRIQSQPTRSREENRKIARKILGERLDLIRARATATIGTLEGQGEEGKTRKEKEKVLAGQWSRDEIRWEKERRRKLNKAKKAKKKRKSSDSESDGAGSELS